MLDGIFIGATRTREMRNMMAVALAVYIVAALTLVPLVGNHGLWVALLLSFVARGGGAGGWNPAPQAAAGGAPRGPAGRPARGPDGGRDRRGGILGRK